MDISNEEHSPASSKVTRQSAATLIAKTIYQDLILAKTKVSSDRSTLFNTTSKPDHSAYESSDMQNKF